VWKTYEYFGQEILAIKDRTKTYLSVYPFTYPVNFKFQYLDNSYLNEKESIKTRTNMSFVGL
jgi:hypothetical protein